MYLVCLTSHAPEHCPNDRYLRGPVLSVHRDEGGAKAAADAERSGPCGVELLHGAEVFHVDPASLERRRVDVTVPTSCPPCEGYVAGIFSLEDCVDLHDQIHRHGAWLPTADHGEWQPASHQPFWTSPDPDSWKTYLDRRLGFERARITG